MAFAVVTGICIALVSPMPVIASAAPRAAVARSRFGIMLMIDSYVGPSAGPCSDKCPSFQGVPQRAQPTLRDGQLDRRAGGGLAVLERFASAVTITSARAC